ncbi:uncharacterized protein LOC114264395 [Camellia sinensis]|uniref:uncharacterized protein LOC114264395 n=1 Tax=Camellia sinensis TaxID=4442 RepID=UPI001035BEBE|nr:uncharacterized protein LOC114264395 [Camellia sinensis]
MSIHIHGKGLRVHLMRNTSLGVFVYGNKRELLKLEQKNKTVVEYEVEFTKLSKFAPALVADKDSRAQKFEVSINGKELLVDLIVLDMQDFDIIFRMDWLVANYAYVDCRGKRVVFQIPDQPEFCFLGSGVNIPLVILTLQARRLLRNGCKGYLASVRDTHATELKLKNILIGKKFSDVFPKDFPGLPPDREVEFVIK